VEKESLRLYMSNAFDDSIYVAGICPSEVKKHMFVYKKVVSLNEGGRSAKVKYLEQVVKEGGN
jgi:hypothetical protein